MTYHLAQINIGRLIAPIDDPKIAEFVAELEPINALADQAPGFVWRLQSESGNATDIAYGDDPFIIVNMSVWQSIEALRDFAYTSDHACVFRDRAKWFGCGYFLATRKAAKNQVILGVAAAEMAGNSRVIEENAE